MPKNLFYEIFTEMHCLGYMDPKTSFECPLSVKLGGTGSKGTTTIREVDVVLNAKFQPWGFNGLGPIILTLWTLTHTHVHLYHIEQ